MKEGVEAELHGGKLGPNERDTPQKFPVEGIGKIRKGSHRNGYY